MSTQVNEHTGSTPNRPTTARYETLLAERITLGRLYVDALCHGAPFDEATLLYGRAARLDRRLDRYRRYSNDYARIVMAAEDERWHVPGQPPAAAPECRRCIKSAIGPPLNMVVSLQSLPARRAA